MRYIVVISITVLQSSSVKSFCNAELNLNLYLQ